MPGPRKAAARAVVGNLELLQARLLQQRDLGIQPAPALGKIGHRLGVAEVHLVDDGQHGNLEQDGVQPGPADGDVDLAIGQRLHRDALLVEVEQAQEIDEIALDEAQRAQVGQLRSEEHTSELQSPCNLVCRLLLEKKKKKHCDNASSITRHNAH